MDKGAWWATVRGIAQSQTLKQLSMHTCIHTSMWNLKYDADELIYRMDS